MQTHTHTCTYSHTHTHTHTHACTHTSVYTHTHMYASTAHINTQTHASACVHTHTHTCGHTHTYKHTYKQNTLLCSPSSTGKLMSSEMNMPWSGGNFKPCISIAILSLLVIFLYELQVIILWILITFIDSIDNNHSQTTPPSNEIHKHIALMFL